MFVREVGAAFSKSSALCAAYQDEYSDDHYLLHSIGFLSPPLPRTVVDIRWTSFFDAACIVMDAWELILPFMKKVAKEHTSLCIKSKKVLNLANTVASSDMSLVREKLRTVLYALNHFMKVLKLFESNDATGPNVFDAVESLQTLVASKHEAAISSKNHLENWKAKSLVYEELDEILLSHEQVTGIPPKERAFSEKRIQETFLCAIEFWERAWKKWREVMQDHTENQFESGNFWDLIRFFNPVHMSLHVKNVERKDSIKQDLMHEFPCLKHDHLREELSKYMCCCETMCASSDIQAWATPPATTILPHLSTFVLDLMCFIPSTAAVERSFSIMGCNDTPKRSRLAPERLGAMNLLRANRDFIFRTQIGRIFGTDQSINLGEMKRTKSCSSNSSGRVSWNRWSWGHLLEKASDEIAGRPPWVDDEESV